MRTGTLGLRVMERGSDFVVEGLRFEAYWFSCLHSSTSLYGPEQHSPAA